MLSKIRLKLLQVLPKLAKLAIEASMTDLSDLAKSDPSILNRTATIRIYDESGEELCFFVGLKRSGNKIEPHIETDVCRAATTEIRMHIDTFIAILKKEVDFRTAYLHGLVEIKSYDGRPPFYHFMIWSSFFDKLVSLL